MQGLYQGVDAPYRARMTAPDVGLRRVPIGELYVALSAGLAMVVALGGAPPTALLALFLLMLPAAIVPFSIAVNVVFLAEGFPSDGWAWQLAFVLLVAVLAWLQMRMFRTIARNWHSPEPGLRREPVTGV